MEDVATGRVSVFEQLSQIHTKRKLNDFDDEIDNKKFLPQEVADPRYDSDSDNAGGV